MRTLKSGFILGFTLFSTVSALGAPEVSLRKIVDEVNVEKEQLLKKEKLKRNVLGELYSVNKSLKKINSERSKIEKNLKRAGENVDSLTTIIAQLGEKIGAQRIALRARMKVLSKLQGQNVSRLLFASNSSGELDLNLRTIRIITENDFRLLKNFQQNLRVYRSQKSKLDVQQTKYAKLKRNLDEKERNLATEIDKKNVMLKTIDTSRLLHITQLKRLRLQGESTPNSELELKKIKATEDLLKPQMFEQKGTLVSPVDGKILKRYGLYEDDQSKTKIRFKGTLISARRGVPIRSIFEGKVVFANWLDGYGHTVIVDHGDEYFSIYGNSVAKEAKVGDSVKAGGTIGYVSEASGFLGSGLYFELRHFSEPEDPGEWIKGS